MELKKYKLGELADFYGGVAYKPSDITNEGIRIIRGGNIQNGVILEKADDVFLPLSYANPENQIHIYDTIIVSSTGSIDALAKAATCFEEMPGTQIGVFLRIIRPKDKKNAMLVSAWCTSQHFRDYMINCAKGTSINNIRTDFLENYELVVPSDENVRGLSSLYFNIERKLYLNRQINANLEALAKQLYDYWFVQFDFPDANGKPYKSSGGKMTYNPVFKRNIPLDWDVRTIQDIESNIITGKTPSTAEEDNFGGEIPFVTIDDIRRFPYIYDSERTLSRKGADSQKKKYLPIGSLCCSCIGTPGVIGILGKVAQTNQQINAIIFENDYNREYLYFALHWHFSYAKAKVGNILPNMSKEEFAHIIVLYPKVRVVKQFHELVKPIFAKIDNCVREISSLTKQRDELLPLLMNGQATIE